MPDDEKPDLSPISKTLVDDRVREQIFMLHLSGLTWEQACKQCLPPPFDAFIARMLIRRFPEDRHDV